MALLLQLRISSAAAEIYLALMKTSFPFSAKADQFFHFMFIRAETGRKQ